MEKSKIVSYYIPMISVKPNPVGDNGKETFVLAHISDLHLSSLTGVSLTSLLNKRLLGYLSWHRRRRHIHSPHVLDALLLDLAEAAPGHVAVTGDLTNLGLPDEFRQAALWLKRLGTPERVTVVPGNHDTYVATSWQDTFSQWTPYLAGDDDGAAAGIYPSLRVRGPAALIGLSSARPSMPFVAVGSLGHQQLARFEEVLEQTGRLGLLRIVLIHHPPIPGSISWRKRLTDAPLFGEVIARQGAELILHGHAHVSMEEELVAGARHIPVLGVPSASNSSPIPQRTARYHICRFEHTAGGWILRLTVRAYSPAQNRFVAGTEKEIRLPAISDESPTSRL